MLPSRSLIPALLLALAIGVALPEPALAQGEVENAEWIVEDPSIHERPMRIDLLANVGALDWLHFGISAWFVLPILHDGFVPGINDELDLEFGTYFQWHYWWVCSFSFFRIIPMVGARWMFHLLSELSIYAVIRLGAAIGFGDVNSCNAGVNTPWLHNFAGYGGIGLNYAISDGIDLRAELGNYGAHVGVSFHL